MSRKDPVSKKGSLISVGEPFLHVDIPKGQYLKKLQQTPQGVDIEWGTPKKIALLFICLNDRYWPYVAQVIKDCRTNFLPEHQVDYFVWTDYNEENKKKQISDLEDLVTAWRLAPPEKKPEALGAFLNVFVMIVRLYEHFYAQKLQMAMQELVAQGIFFKRDGEKFWLECARPTVTELDVQMVHEVAKHILLLAQSDMDESLKDVTIIDTDAVPWPSPTLMRYHLFLNEEEKLKDYDYLFYLDADMRVVAKIGDEILGSELTAAEHPMYSLRKEYVPPYEPNAESSAYIERPGKVIDDNGKPRFKPYYYAGGFQGGVTKCFIKAMSVMKKNIDKDFDKNYIAVWNDESHWNKYLFGHEGDCIVLSPSYVYPDSLVDEYYVKIWGKKYEPKIITLTKPFTLSAAGAEAIKEFTSQ